MRAVGQEQQAAVDDQHDQAEADQPRHDPAVNVRDVVEELVERL